MICGTITINKRKEDIFVIHSTGSYASSDGRSTIIYSLWAPETPPRAVLQISHGMCEYIERYAAFAEYLTGHGFAVAGNDHIGHGRSAAAAEELGYIPRAAGGDALVADLWTLTGIIKQKYPGLPYFLLGHSMGSFIARLYLAAHGEALDGAVIMGTGGPGNPTGPAKFMARADATFHSGHHRSSFINDLAFGSYTKHFGKNATQYDWLSRDEDNKRRYAADPFCTFTFTADGFYTLFDMLGRVSDKKWPEMLPKSLPVLMVSGADDPVGDYGRGVEKIYRRLTAAGLTDVTLRLYPEDRHEILNEIDRDRVYADILAWFESKLNKSKDN